MDVGYMVPYVYIYISLTYSYITQLIDEPLGINFIIGKMKHQPSRV